MAGELQMQKKLAPETNGAEKPDSKVTYIPADETMPKFDFSRVNRRWSKAWLRVSAGAMQDSTLFDSVPKPGISDEQKQQVVQAKLEAAERLGNVYDDQDRLMAQVLTFVPRHWLSADAPEKLDWSDPESLNWILESKSKALTDALDEARRGGN